MVTTPNQGGLIDATGMKRCVVVVCVCVRGGGAMCLPATPQILLCTKRVAFFLCVFVVLQVTECCCASLPAK